MLVVPPDGEARAAVLLLHGSSGRPEIEMAALLAAQGAAVLAPQWFGSVGQPPGICEIPLEYFIKAIDRLQEQYPGAGVGLVGISKGAEAALIVAARDVRVSSVVAVAPSSVIWANVGPGSDGLAHPDRSSWTAADKPLPFVPYDKAWSPAESDAPVAYRSMYEQSLVTHADRVVDATIAVEQIHGRVLLVCGGDDQVWPATLFAEQIQSRRQVHGLETELVSDPFAGHRMIVPGATPRGASGGMMRGGSLAADHRLGAAAWPKMLATLALDNPVK